MSGLRLGERQVVEIARALSDEARVLILDEPTAALSNDETVRLFEFIRRLREHGTAMIYITHRLDEVRQIADDVVVLRDGNLVLEATVGDRSRAELVEAMVGASVEAVGRPDRALEPSAEVPRLVLRAATSGRAFTDVDLDVWPGEVVGLYGKVGSGIVEVAEATFGLRSLTSGSATVDGRPTPAHPRDAVARGIGFLPADRKQDGAFMALSCARNLAAPTWSRHAVGRVWLNGNRETATFERWRKALRIRVAPGGANRPIATLSGGNQQKVMLARWLQAESQLLVLVEPTRGVDVGARQEIYATVRALARTGVAVLVASSDYEEIVQLADRAGVMSRGRLVKRSRLRRGHDADIDGRGRGMNTLGVDDVQPDDEVSAPATASVPDGQHAVPGGEVAQEATGAGRPGRSVPELAALCVVLIGLVVYFSVASEFFLATNNIINILTAIAVTGILAAPGTMLLIAGQVDLSVGAATALCGVVLATVAPDVGIPVAVLSALLAGIAVGVINGALVTVIGVNSLIVTLGGLAAYRGTTFLIADGQTVVMADFQWLGTARPFLNIPVPVILFAIVATVILVVLRYTVYGRNVYAIGANPVAARLVGIRRRTVCSSRSWRRVWRQRSPGSCSRRNSEPRSPTPPSAWN